MRKPILTAVALAASTMFACPMLQAREPAATDKPGQVNAEPVNEAQPETGQNNVRRDKDEVMSAKDMDKHFAMEAANTNLFEIELGTYAQNHVKDSQVKQFAQMMVADHQKSQDELVAWGKTANMDVPTTLDALHQQMLTHLESKKGLRFERAYVYHNVADHQLAVLMFRDASNELSNPELKQFATSTLPTLRHHLGEAEKLAGLNSNEARTAGERIPADSPSASNDSKTPVSAENNGIQSNQGAPSGKDTAAQTSVNSDKK